MFSFVLVGQIWRKRTNIYNTLAASALVLLMVDPFMLFGVGFQLSYAALLGIVYFHPKIYACWKAPNRLLQWTWNGLALSLAAQLGTAPLSLYYFRQFPLYFWLSGVVVMLVAGPILAVGLALLLFQTVPWVSGLLGKLLYGLLWGTNSLIFAIQQLPGAVSEGWWWTGTQLVLAYGIIVGLDWTLKRRQLKWALVPLAALLLWLGLDIQRAQDQLQQQQLCLHHHRSGGFLSWVQGQSCTTIGDSSLAPAAARQYAQQYYLYAKGIQQEVYHPWEATVEQSQLFYATHRLQVGPQRLAVVLPEHLRQASHTPLRVDYLWLQQNLRLKDLEELEALYEYQHLVFDASSPAYRRSAWAEACQERGIPYTDLAEEGALLIDL